MKKKSLFSIICCVLMMIVCTACSMPKSNGSTRNVEENKVTTAYEKVAEVAFTTALPSREVLATQTYLDDELKINYARPNGTPNIVYGDHGDEVGWVQEALNLINDKDMVVDCDFGNSTRSNVKDFQSRAGISADGAVGPKTIEMLVAYASGNKTFPVTTTIAKAIQTTATTTKKQYTYTTTTKAQTVYVAPQTQAPKKNTVSGNYIANSNTGKFHKSGCSSVDKMNESNKVPFSSREAAINAGYVPCKKCNP